MPKKDLGLRDKLEDDELDLSLMNITDVPVKEIAALPKGTTVDLSSNHISLLPANFVTLFHINKLDLSRNSLSELPSDFGKMRQLKHLDLYSNKLKHLPASFGLLKNLRWLDLKNNILVPRLQTVAGDCVDQRQCELCARQVVAFMTKIAEQMEREREAKIRAQKEREDAEKEAEEIEREKIRVERKAKKDKKKAEQREARLKEESKKVALENGQSCGGESPVKISSNKRPAATKQHPPKKRWSLLSKLNFVLFIWLLVGAGVAVYVHTGGKLDKQSLTAGWAKAQKNAEYLMTQGKRYGGKVMLTGQEYGSKAVVAASHWGTVAGDMLVTQATAFINWSGEKLVATEAFMDENGGDVWKAISSTSGHYWGVAKNQSQVAWSYGQKYAVQGYDWVLTEGPKLTRHAWLTLCNKTAETWYYIQTNGPQLLDSLWQKTVSTAMEAKEAVMAALKPAAGKT